ncbi:MAG: flagellar export protein FliJ [Desulfobulbus sp.]|nr:flagellar export protein FliJ [Desulfobulbus sp.]
MKPFRLHAVLNYRQQLEDTARQDLHHALELERKLHQSIREAEEDLQSRFLEIQRNKETGTTVDWLLLLEYQIDLLKEKLTALHDELRQQQAQVTVKQQQLIKTSQDRKIMEKLQEQQNSAYARYLEKKELIMLDEIAVLSHARRKR